MNAPLEEVNRMREALPKSIESLHAGIEDMWDAIIKTRNSPDLTTKDIDSLEEMSAWMKKATEEYKNLVISMRQLDPEYNPNPFMGPQRWLDEVEPI
jgi:hypothetical protein